ncbi:patatin-like phospholipase family protein [Halosquirtibacter laminarini]|uniref:Patatin-like phospholipase family protein n=1 Tax=Halosquirtibacter laminarini TaxID=3374600 RepID=A0AC61NPQ0_9BACT|nr:patatin-like phospholipase family protein [Prolixibacteraceae bacterium]
MKDETKKSIGLALSGGGARGIAHIGVIQALEEANISIKAISGTSMGAFIGALYASGYSPKEMLDLFNKKHVKDLFHPKIKSHGLIKVALKENGLSNIFKAKTFEELELPLFISVSNITKGALEVVHHGEYLPYVIASCAIPVIFPSQIINDQCYVDGGLYDNLPAKSLLDSCASILGVHVNYNGERVIESGVKAVAERCFQLAIGSNVKDSVKHCNWLVEPKELRNYGTFAFLEKEEIFQIGYDYGKKVIKNKIIPDICT